MNRMKRDVTVFLSEHREKIPYAIAVLVVLVFYTISRGRETVTVYHSEGKVDFKDARVLGSSGESLYENKERLLSRTVKDIVAAQQGLKDATGKLEARLAELEKGKGEAKGSGGADGKGAEGAASSPTAETHDQEGLIRRGAPPEDLEIKKARPRTSAAEGVGGPVPRQPPSRAARGGLISFPVKDVPRETTSNVAIPPGSYVKAKLMTGIEAPEGKTYPVLLQLDYAYIVPNRKKLDLSGCFMIAKSQGILSTERVEMQATKLSCVSKDGKMFERDVNGFIADDKDNSFAVMGSVNSKQDRVAAMAFLSSVVEGVGKSIQQAQTTQSTNPLGGNTSIVTGSGAAYLGAGGAANAAGMVTQWYLRQAQNLLPTINVGSGQDVWIVMQETVKLPNDYFRKISKGGTGEASYTYLSRIGD